MLTNAQAKTHKFCNFRSDKRTDHQQPESVVRKREDNGFLHLPLYDKKTRGHLQPALFRH
jgi:hypothetical protein